MKPTIPTKRKLLLAADVIRQLRTVDPAELRQIRGGIDDQTRSCDAANNGG
jgi:hypothetical protein